MFMMNNVLHRIPRTAGLLGLGGCLTLALSAPAQDTNAPTVMKPTVVTGSYIPTAETVGPAPLQTLTTEAIDQSGQADPLLTLKKLVPSFTGSGNYLGSVNNNVILGAGFQGFTGESYAALRNLPTLILLDGQRITSTALSGAQAVDLNSIPLAMIDRVEVLKDGASAIYGSDAIGGVINIITKKSFNGFEFGGRYGFPTEGPGNQAVQYQAHFVLGASSDTTRFTAGGQIFEANPLLAKDRHIASQGIAELAANNIVPTPYFSPSFPGRVQDSSGTYLLASSPFAAGGVGYNPNLTTPPVFAGHSFTTIGAYNTYAQAHGYTDPTGHGLGPYIPIQDTPAGLDLIAIGQGSPWLALNTTAYGAATFLDQDRRQFWANAEQDIFGDKLTVYSHFLFSDNMAKGALAPSPVVSLTLYHIAVPADNPYNPFQIALGGGGGAGSPRIRSRFVDFGNRDFQTFSDFYQWSGGLKGNITPDYSYDVSFDYSKDRQEQQTRNAVNGAGLNQALIPSGAVDPQGRPLSMLTDANGNNLPVYNIFSPGIAPGTGGNALETINALRATLFTWGETELYSGQGVFRASPIDLPGGKLNIAVGGQYIHESLSLQVDGLFKLGLVPGLNAAQEFNGGKRETTAGFIEVNVPILGKDQAIPGLYDLELTVAGRYQTFDPGGDAAVPKVGILWKPVDEQITVRASYGQGFIAPSIFNLFGPGFLNQPSVTINGVNGQVQSTTLANPNLKSSDAEQFGGGIVLSPKFAKGLTVGIDYYHVTENHLPIADAQSAANSLNALGAASPYAPGFTFFDNSRLTTTAPGQVTIDNWGNLNLPWSPAGSLRTEGLDLSANYILPLDDKYGKVTVGVVANVILNYEVSTGTGRPFFDYTGTWTPAQGLIPDYNITPSLTYEYAGWTFNASAHYLPSASDPGGLFPEYNLGAQGFTINNPTQPYHISDYYTVDLQLSYEFGKGKTEGRRWYDGTRLTAGVNNVADAQAPLIADSPEDNTDKNNYDILGRFIYFEFSKKF